MNTPTTNYIEIDGEGKWVEDTDAREMATQNANNIETINSKIPAAASSTNKFATQSQIDNLTTIVNSKSKVQIMLFPFSVTLSGQLITSITKIGDIPAGATPIAFYIDTTNQHILDTMATVELYASSQIFIKIFGGSGTHDGTVKMAYI